MRRYSLHNHPSSLGGARSALVAKHTACSENHTGEERPCILNCCFNTRENHEQRCDPEVRFATSSNLTKGSSAPYSLDDSVVVRAGRGQVAMETGITEKAQKGEGGNGHKFISVSIYLRHYD